MRKVEGGCHCGNIRFRLWWPDEKGAIPARACGCSFCRPRRARYTSHSAARLEAKVVDESRLSRYRFGTATAEFFVCRRCGGMAFAISEIEGRLHAVVNVLTFDDAETMEFDVSSTDFDGEDIDQRLSRRSRNWIPDVIVQFDQTR